MNDAGTATTLVVVGCDFRTASSRWRSRLVLDSERAKQIASDLRRNGAAEGFVDLSTCNRNEWIVSSNDPRWASELLRTQMKLLMDPKPQGIEPYVLIGEEATRHVLRVAIGQESLVVGERQIAGQLFKALEAARARQTSCRTLNGLGAVAGRLVRIAVRRGCVGHSAKGVHNLAISYLERHFEHPDQLRVAVVGLGSIGRRVLGLLEERPGFKPIGCNRTVDEDATDRIRPLTDLRELLTEVDAAIVCTGAQQRIIDSAGLPSRDPSHPLVMIDIGIPEQVIREGVPDGVLVAGLDELTSFHQGSKHDDGFPEGEIAETLVQRAMTEFQIFCNRAPLRELLDTIQRHNRLLVWEEIPRLVAEGFEYVPEESRSTLEQDLKQIVLNYTSEVFRTIRETSVRKGEPSQ